MTLKFLSNEDKKQICSWRYAGKFFIYNLPSYNKLNSKNTSLFDSEKDKEYTAFIRMQLYTGAFELE